MNDPFGRLRSFLRELKRRKVYRVAAVYAGVAFVTLQAARLIFPATTIEGVYDVLVVIAFVGFPIALVLAWAFEVTPEGVRRTPEAGPIEEPPSEASQDLSTGYKLLVGLGLVAAAVAGGWYLTGGGGGDNPEITDRSVAVLPFEALGEEKPGTFTEGMHSDLQTKLSNVAGLTVTSSRSVERYRGSEETTGAVARELGVGWIVTGDVQRMGDQIQVNVRLVDPDTDAQAWSDSYRRDLTAENLFAIQSDITNEVAQALNARLSPEETNRVERQPTRSLEAHRLYAQGRRLILSRRPDSLRRAVERFERAIERDSSYALAWAGLSDARILYANYSSSGQAWLDSMEYALSEAKSTATQALELDPDLAEAHASRAILYMYEQLLPEGRTTGLVALGHLRRAVELKPSYAQAHHWLGVLLTMLGRADRGLDHIGLSVELSPDNRSAQRAFVSSLLVNERYEQALREARRLKKRFPDDESTYVPFESGSLIHLKRWDEVRTLAGKHSRNSDDPPAWTVLSLALADVAAGDTSAARDRIRDMRATGNDFDAALVRAALGETDRAFKRLPELEYWSVRYFEAFRYLYPDLLSPFRQDPRYETAMRRVNEYWGLNPDGSLPDSVDVSFTSEPDG